MRYFFSFLLFSSVVFAQEQTEMQAEVKAPQPVVNFRGVVLERGTRDPLAGIKVVVVSKDDTTQAFETLTDAEGAFQFFDLALNTWNIIIAAPQYQTFKTSELLQANEILETKYYLEKKSYNPLDVLVKGEKPRKEVNRLTISRDEIDKVPGTFGDPLRVVQNLPGVARQNNTANIIVRGSAPEDTFIAVDGINVPIIFHFGGLRSTLPLGVLESIDYYPGNFSTYYGRATGGVLDIKTRKLTAEKVHGYADISLLDASLFLETPIGSKVNIAAGVRRSYIDGVLKLVIPEDSDINPTVAPRYYDYQLLATYRPSTKQELRAFFFGSDDRLEILFKNPSDLDVTLTGDRFKNSTRYYRAILEHQYTFDENIQNIAKFSIGRDFINFSLGDDLVFDLAFVQMQLRDTLQWRLNSWLQLKTGIDTLVTVSDGSIHLPKPPKEGETVDRFDASTTISSDFKGLTYFSPAVFAELEMKLGQHLLVFPGMRLDYFQSVERVSVDPRISARYNFLPEFTAKAGIGLFHQAPQPDESDEDFGNPDLGLEKAMHYAVGIEYKPLAYLLFDVTLFYKDLYNLVVPSQNVVERDGSFVPENYNNNGHGHVYGVETLIRHNFAHNLTGWLSYTLSRSERIDNFSSSYRLFDTDQTHILTALATYRLPRNWEIGARWRLVSGNPNTPVTGSVFNSDADRYLPIYGPTNSTRIAPFHQLDIRVDKRFVFNTWMLAFYLDVQNAYYRKNPEGVSYNYDYSEKQTVEGLPILPILGVKGEF